MQKNSHALLRWITNRSRGVLPRQMSGFDPGSPLVLAEDVQTITLAQINAGKTVFPSIPGLQLKILNFCLKSTGAFAVLDSILFQDLADTPVVIATFAQAQLTNGAILLPGSTGVTLGAGFTGNCTLGKGLQIIKSGTAGTTATGIDFWFTYKYVNSVS